jgi:hypothetical protein
MIPDDPTFQSFGLIWRFSDADKYTQLSTAEFLRFHPLPECESLKQWKQFIYPDASPGHRHLKELYVQQLVTWPQNISFRSESRDEERRVVQNLQREIAAVDSSEVFFFWHAEQSVRTDWRLFLDHWDDFCYPSDDGNILVLPSLMKAFVYDEERWHILNWTTMGPIFATSRR